MMQTSQTTQPLDQNQGLSSQMPSSSVAGRIGPDKAWTPSASGSGAERTTRLHPSGNGTPGPLGITGRQSSFATDGNDYAFISS